MAALPIFTTFVAGTVLTAAALQQATNTNVSFVAAPPLVWVYDATGTISCTTSILTLVTFNTEILDADNMHNNATNPSRIIAQTLGTYDMCPCVRFPSNATGFRNLNIRMNAAGSNSGGTNIRSVPVAAANGTATIVIAAGTYWTPTNIGDYLEIFAQQSSGGTLALDAGSLVTGFTGRLVSL